MENKRQVHSLAIVLSNLLRIAECRLINNFRQEVLTLGTQDVNFRLIETASFRLITLHTVRDVRTASILKVFIITLAKANGSFIKISILL